MQHRAKCKCMLRLVMAEDYVELQCSENCHQADSHAQDDSKTLKYDQMVANREAVIIAPQLSATILRQNMKLHDRLTKTISPDHIRSFQHQVYCTCKKLCANQLKAFELDDFYGKLDEFAESNTWSALVRRHKDEEDGHHSRLHTVMPGSARSMGLTSSGHPRAGPGGLTDPLRHRRLRMSGSEPHAPDAPPAAGANRAVSGPRELRVDACLGGCHRLPDPIGPREPWAANISRRSWTDSQLAVTRVKLNFFFGHSILCRWS
jgi:hypothetical protein